jgi:hypothetical protein
MTPTLMAFARSGGAPMAMAGARPANAPGECAVRVRRLYVNPDCRPP